jgi:hypothetical protein
VRLDQREVVRLDMPALVAVGRRGVDVPVAGLQGHLDGGAGFLRGVWKTPKPSTGISTPWFSCTFGMIAYVAGCSLGPAFANVP